MGDNGQRMLQHRLFVVAVFCPFSDIFMWSVNSYWRTTHILLVWATRLSKRWCTSTNIYLIIYPFAIFETLPLNFKWDFQYPLYYCTPILIALLKSPFGRWNSPFQNRMASLPFCLQIWPTSRHVWRTGRRLRAGHARNAVSVCFCLWGRSN